MSQSDHFALLGAPLKNARWSWGAERPTDGAVFLRVWKDEIRTRHDGSQFVLIMRYDESRNSQPGYLERLRHVDLLRNGARGYLIFVEAADKSARPRIVIDFDQNEVIRTGRLEENDREVLVELLDRVRIEDAMPG